MNYSKTIDKFGEFYAAEAEYKELATGNRKMLPEIRRNYPPKKSKKLVSEIYALKDEISAKIARFILMLKKLKIFFPVLRSMFRPPAIIF